MKINLLCCAPGCKNWIRIEKGSFATAERAGWFVPDVLRADWDGYAACPAQHFTVEQATVAELRAALKGLPGDTVVRLPGGQDSQALVVGARKARNRSA